MLVCRDVMCGLYIVCCACVWIRHFVPRVADLPCGLSRPYRDTCTRACYSSQVLQSDRIILDAQFGPTWHFFVPGVLKLLAF